MGRELVEITGWKWTTLKEFNASETKAMSDLTLPRGKDDLTTSVMNPLISLTSKGGVDFYYVGQNDTSQLKSTLGNPIVFDIAVNI